MYNIPGNCIYIHVYPHEEIAQPLFLTINTSVLCPSLVPSPIMSVATQEKVYI